MMAAMTATQCDKHREERNTLCKLNRKPIEQRLGSIENMQRRLANGRRAWALLVVAQLFAGALTLWAADRAASQTSELKPLVVEFAKAVKDLADRK